MFAIDGLRHIDVFGEKKMIKNENLTMLTDFYELTMANGYLKSGMKDHIEHER